MSILLIPLTMKVSSKLFKYIADTKGDKHSPCLTPFSHKKDSDNLPWILTNDFVQLYLYTPYNIYHPASNSKCYKFIP